MKWCNLFREKPTDDELRFGIRDTIKTGEQVKDVNKIVLWDLLNCG